ncbi:hypothetical protein EYZ11_008107 [Aspergillus tanneri]|uniref:Inositolphosphotransferase Aur1/Ipt1 domain-containing protein n=1 Tax=Aspergillus tanneri TaxID=1220188 RepID=A0A4S3JDH3_9EURO|nr:uncharacterized protein ATNIH1004_009224 [Aspergillus tanneri]KAA8645013.1 hypothetical protein ATNIH1004_009224 [Aspergillus tanneri]THC92417.1 hypothetical protein EYZ11_008107 [Aspergillus tanneri]
MATTALESQAQQPDLGKPQFASHTWLEPIVVVGIMIGSLIVNRRRNYSILGRKSSGLNDTYPDEDEDTYGGNGQYSRTQSVCGITFKTPDSSRWAHHIHSRIIQKYPFLVEMFYWAVNFLFYSFTKAIAQWLSPAEIGVVQVAQNHAIDILNFEHKSFFSFLFIEESEFQSFFMTNHPSIMTFFNRIYSLVHIPGTVLFLSWYYYAAEDHNAFAVARRTMTLGNFAAFMIFCFYPCMPPRMLPEAYHFYDTVRQDHAESVWVGGQSINQLAAMPSLHFTYAFVIGCTFLYHSGILPKFCGRPARKSLFKQILYITLAIVYPLLVLGVIVATANHYWSDALVAMFSVAICFLGNRVLLLLLPVEYLVCWALRLAKPKPTTGYRSLSKYHSRQDDVQYNPV